jgi:hypothetical protein
MFGQRTARLMQLVKGLHFTDRAIEDAKWDCVDDCEEQGDERDECVLGERDLGVDC